MPLETARQRCSGLHMEETTVTELDDRYELLDSGGGRVLERLGSLISVRPNPQAWWRRKLGGAEWRKAVELKRALNQPTKVRFGRQLMLLGGTGGNLRALGPELQVSWQSVTAACEAFTAKYRRPARVLNLFGGVGGHTAAAALGGATVAHVEVANESLGRARENAALNPQASRDIRWVLEDPVKFAQRERTQNQRYDLIIVDPHSPREAKQGFNIERDLGALLGTVSAMLSESPLGVVLVCRQIGVSPTTLSHLMRHDLSIFDLPVRHFCLRLADFLFRDVGQRFAFLQPSLRCRAVFDEIFEPVDLALLFGQRRPRGGQHRLFLVVAQRGQQRALFDEIAILEEKSRHRLRDVRADVRRLKSLHRADRVQIERVVFRLHLRDLHLHSALGRF